MNPSHMKKYTFNNDVWNFAYLLSFSIAFATHSIWLVSCGICLDVKLWHGFIEKLPRATRVGNPDIIVPAIGALLVGIFFFVAESLRDTNTSVRSRVILKQSEIVPLTGCFVLLILLINDETRITFLLPALILTAHTLYALGTILRLLADSQRMHEASIIVFKEEAHTELLTTLQDQHDQNQSAVLREFQAVASTALNNGDVSQYVYAQSYFEAYLDVVLTANSHDGLKNFQVAYKDLITTTQIVDRIGMYRKVITKIFKMYISTLRKQKYAEAERILYLLQLIQWPDDGRSSQRTGEICTIINELFDSYLKAYFYNLRSEKNYTAYQKWLNTTLNVMYYIALTGIERNMPEIVGQYLSSMYKLTKGVCYEINNSVTHPAGDFPYRVARDVDGFVLRCFAASLKYSLRETHMNSVMSDMFVQVFSNSPTFTWLIHAIATWRWSKDTQIRIRVLTDGFEVDEDEFIYLLSTVIILQKLRKQHKYISGMALCTLADQENIREFSEALVNNQAWIASHQATLEPYLADIQGEIRNWLLPDATLIASQMK